MQFSLHRYSFDGKTILNSNLIVRLGVNLWINSYHYIYINFNNKFKKSFSFKANALYICMHYNPNQNKLMKDILYIECCEPLLTTYFTLAIDRVFCNGQWIHDKQSKINVTQIYAHQFEFV